MDLTSALGLLAVLVLVLANGFFVATEFAIVAVRRSRLEQLAAAGSASARSAKEVVGRLDTYIAACQLGITMASLALGWIGEPAFAHLVEPPLEAVVGQVAPQAARGVAVGVAFAIITGLHIVIGELAPKGLALQKPESTTLWIAGPIRLFYAIFRWPIHALNAVGNGVLKLFGLEPATGHEMVHSVEELRLLVTGMQQAGVVEATEARIASHAFQFGELTAGALMTPRTEIEAVPVTASLAELIERARSGAHSRLPVYDGSLDNMLGVFHVRDLFKLLGQDPRTFSLRAALRPLPTVPASKPADDLLEEMRATRRQLVLVVDEYGGTAGIATLEDLVAALVGRIDAESEDAGADRGVADSTASRPDGALVLDGRTRLNEVEELLGVAVDDELRESVDSLGGLVMASLGRIPRQGDAVALDGRILRVERMEGRRVAQVRVLDRDEARQAPGRPAPS